MPPPLEKLPLGGVVGKGGVGDCEDADVVNAAAAATVVVGGGIIGERGVGYRQACRGWGMPPPPPWSLSGAESLESVEFDYDECSRKVIVNAASTTETEVRSGVVGEGGVSDGERAIVEDAATAEATGILSLDDCQAADGRGYGRCHRLGRHG